MIEINFTEKKKTDVSYYLIIAIALVVSLGIGIFFYAYQSIMESKSETLSAEKTTNDRTLEDLNHYLVTDQQIKTLEKQIDQLKVDVFPTTFILQDTKASLPNENSTLLSFSFKKTEGITMELQVESYKRIAEFSRALTNKAYIDQLQLDEVIRSGENYVATFSFKLVEDSLPEEVDMK